MLRTLSALTAAVALAACTVPDIKPVVSEFNGDSVELQVPLYANSLDAADKAALQTETKAEAKRICNKAGRKHAEFVSQRTTMTSNYTGYHTGLYLCLN